MAGKTNLEQPLPIQPVPKPILCSPYEKPDKHWLYNPETGQPTENPDGATPAIGTRQSARACSAGLFAEEERDDLPLVNALRKDVDRWREADYRGASNVTRELLKHWSREDRGRRLFFCQREAVETIIYLAELRISGRSSRTRFQEL